MDGGGDWRAANGVFALDAAPMALRCGFWRMLVLQPYDNCGHGVGVYSAWRYVGRRLGFGEHVRHYSLAGGTVMELADIWDKISAYSTPLISAAIPATIAVFFARRTDRRKELTALQVAQNDASLRAQAMVSQGQEALFNRLTAENADLRKQLDKSELETDEARKYVRRMQAEGLASKSPPAFRPHDYPSGE